MRIIQLDDSVLYQAEEGKKVMFVNDPKKTLYCEIELKERQDDKIVEVD